MVLPLDPDLIVYTCLWHRSPRGNPLAIYEAQKRLAPHKRAVWIVRSEDSSTSNADVTVVKPRSFAYLKAIATAGTIVDDANPVWRLPARKGQIYVQTHHGTALKFMGADRHYSGDSAPDKDLQVLQRRCMRWTYSLVASDYSAEVWRRAYNPLVPQLRVGTPRNDQLVVADPGRRARVRELLGLSDEQRAVLYMPTWRDREGPRRDGIGFEDVLARLGSQDVLLVRDHYFHDHRSRRRLPSSAIDVSRDWQVEDLYFASDILVTDYSSAMFDYLLTDKPIAIIADDWDVYTVERGVYFDLTRDAPGPVVTSRASLTSAIQQESDDFRTVRKTFRDRFCTYEDGNAAEKVVRVALLGESPAALVPQEARFDPPVGWIDKPPAPFVQR